MLTQVSRPRVLNVTTAAVESMVGNPTLREKFPFLQHAHGQWDRMHREFKSGCCGRKHQLFRPQRDHLVELVKQSVAVLVPEQAQVMKSLMNVDRIIVFFTSNGQIVRKEL